MYNPRKIIDLIEKNNLQKKALLDYMGKNWNGSVLAVVKGDIRVSKLERIADFFGVPIDTFFDRECPNNGLQIGGSQNRVHHFSITSDNSAVKNLEALIEEKDKRIKTLEEMIEILKRNQIAD